MAWTVQVVTPERPVMTAAARVLSVVTTDGQLTVLPGHAELVALVPPSRLQVVEDATGALRDLFVADGVLWVNSQGVSLAAAVAEELAAAALERAQQALEKASTEPTRRLAAARLDAVQASVAQASPQRS